MRADGHIRHCVQRPRVTDAARTARHRWWKAEVCQPEASTHPSAAKRLTFRPLVPDWERVQPFRYLILFVALVAAATLVSRTKPAKAVWHEMRLVSDAKELAAGGLAGPEHLVFLQRAVGKEPDSPELLRALAQAAQGEDLPLARRCYDRIAELHATTPADLAGQARLLARLHDFDGARALLELAPKTLVESMDLLRARLVLACESEDFALAARMVEALAAQCSPDLNDYLQTVETAVLRGADEGMVARLEKQAVGAFDRAAKAGRIAEIGCSVARLTALPLKDESTRARALDVLRCLEAAPVEQRLAVVLFAHATPSGSREDAGRACLAEVHRGGPVTVLEKLKAAEFLQTRAEHRLVTQLITLPESVTETRLFRLRLRSLLRLGEWREAAAMAAKIDPDTQPQSRRLIRCLARMHRSQPDEAGVMALIPGALEEAMEEDAPAACHTLGVAALENGMHHLASQCFTSAVTLPSMDETLVDAILAEVRRVGLDASATLRLLAAERLPASAVPVVHARLCYLRLLAHEDEAAVRSHLESLNAVPKPDAYTRFLTAMSLHLQGDLLGAMSRLAPLPQRRWHHGETAVIATVMAAAGQFRQSVPLLERVDEKRLFPEERALLAPLQARLAAEKNLLSISTLLRFPDDAPAAR